MGDPIPLFAFIHKSLDAVNNVWKSDNRSIRKNRIHSIFLIFSSYDRYLHLFTKAWMLWPIILSLTTLGWSGTSILVWNNVNPYHNRVDFLFNALIFKHMQILEIQLYMQLTAIKTLHYKQLFIGYSLFGNEVKIVFYPILPYT